MTEEIKLPPKKWAGDLPGVTLVCTVADVEAFLAARPVADAGAQKLDLTDYRTPVVYGNSTGGPFADAGEGSGAQAIFPPEFPKYNPEGLEGTMSPDHLWAYACLVGYRCAAPSARTLSAFADPEFHRLCYVFARAYESEDGTSIPEWASLAAHVDKMHGIANSAPAEAPSVRPLSVVTVARNCTAEREAVVTFSRHVDDEELDAWGRALQGKPEAAKGGSHG